jgi:ActR/RegA family two-component response regulator
MSLSGNLEDVSVADALQFIHLGGRTGTLTLSRGEVTAEIGFHQGRIVNAWGPDSKRLGDLLVDNGSISQDTLDQALRDQEHETPRRSLGQILVALGALSADAMYTAVQHQIERTVYELVTWTSGTFHFALDDLKPIDDISVFPGDIVGHLRLDTQAVLLDALRIFDEKNRGGDPPGGGGVSEATPAVGMEPATPASAIIPAATRAVPIAELEPKPRLQVVSSDKQFAEKLAQAIPAEEATVSRVTLRDAGGPPPGEAPPFVLVDLRDGGVALDAVEQLRRARPRAMILAVVDGGVSLTATYAAGAVAAVPGDMATIGSCFRSLVQARKDILTGGASRADRVQSNLAKLRRIVGDLRSGLISTTISLSLMNIISESVERAVLFLVRREALNALGAFGNSPSGQPLAQLTRGLRLPLTGKNALTRALDDGAVRSLTFDETGLPDTFTRVVGKPRSGQCAVFPVMGGQRVIAVVYADNGPSNRAIEELDILELAAAQAGLALENELLRRQSNQH